MRKTFELGRFSIDLCSDWAQLVGKYNWITFNLFKIYAEKENIHGMFEVEIYLLGFGIRIYWTWNQEMLDEKVKEYNISLAEDKFTELK